MSHFETYWTARDGLSLYAQRWEPSAPAAGVICLVHGLGEHSGRYVYVAETLNAAGFSLFAFDLRGHGKSGGQRGHSPAFETLMDDIGLLLAEAARRDPDRPCFLYGHSLGGLLTLNYVLRRKPALAGVVVTSPGLRSPLTEQTLKINLAKALGALLPRLPVATGLDPNAISHDECVVRAYMDDPLVHDRCTLGATRTTLESIPWALAHAGEFHLPLLLMHGTGDRLTYPHGTQEFAGRVGGECSVRLWDGLAHELHNEPQKDQVLAYLVAWLRSKTPGAAV